MSFLARKFHSPESEFAYLFERMHQLCNKNEWGDSYNYSRSREIHMANTLGHVVAKKYSGADAYEDAEMTIPVEYKSTTTNTIKATFSGISVKNTWSEQLDYLRQPKKFVNIQDTISLAMRVEQLREMFCMDCDPGA